eukprot:6462077-Amphidinium_carterae.1
MLQELETLRERVKELEARGCPRVAPKSSRSSLCSLLLPHKYMLGFLLFDCRGAAEDSSKPSWLRDGSVNRDLAATLPSRRGNLSETNEAAELKTQLREEQRKGKRLEQEVPARQTTLSPTATLTRIGTVKTPHPIKTFYYKTLH